MHFKKANSWLILLFSIFVVTSFILSFSHLASAGLGEDLIAREAWKKISLDLQGASLINVLKVFSQQSGLNFIASQSVADRPITLYLDNVPIREALEKILNSYSLTYILDEGSNIFVVKALIRPEVETITKIYPLKYARVTSSSLNRASARSTSGSSTAGSSTAGSSIVEAVKALLSSYGKLNEDSRTNSLIITDMPLQFEVIESTIRKLDIPVPQVVIEAEIIDTTKELVDTLGMKWSSSLYTLTLASRDGFAFPFQSWRNRDERTNIDTGSINAVGTAATLQLLITDKKTKVLARPRILTLSNEPAEIKITGNDAVGTVTTYDDQGQVQSTSAERYEIGVSLKVTPSVNRSTGEVTMVLEPTVSSVEASNISGIFDPQERSAKVTVALKDGETVVIGGLVRKDLTDTRRKLPVLGDIPFLGALFRHKDADDKDRELLVFITPHIVKEGSVDLAKTTTEEAYNKEILSQREQSDSGNRKEEIDKALSIWDNR